MVAIQRVDWPPIIVIAHPDFGFEPFPLQVDVEEAISGVSHPRDRTADSTPLLCSERVKVNAKTSLESSPKCRSNIKVVQNVYRTGSALALNTKRRFNSATIRVFRDINEFA